jgi:hypothetical protein
MIVNKITVVIMIGDIMTVYKMTRQNDRRKKDCIKITVYETTVYEMTVDKMTVDKMTVNKITVDKMTRSLSISPSNVKISPIKKNLHLH